MLVSVGTRRCAAPISICGLLLAAPGFAAERSFSGRVCSLLSAKQLASVHITPTTCHPHPTVKNSEGTVYDAVWGIDKPIGGPRLNVGILKPTNSLMLQAARARPLKPSLANGKTAANAIFVAGDYIVNVNLETGPKHPLTSIAPFLALTKVIAAKL